MYAYELLSLHPDAHTHWRTCAQAHIYRMKCTHRGVIIADRKSMSFGFCYLRRSVTHTYGLHTPGSSVWHKKQLVDTETRQTNNKKLVNQCQAPHLHNSLKYNQIAWLITEKHQGLSSLSFVLLSLDTFSPRAKLGSRCQSLRWDKALLPSPHNPQTTSTSRLWK